MVGKAKLKAAVARVAEKGDKEVEVAKQKVGEQSMKRKVEEGEAEAGQGIVDLSQPLCHKAGADKNVDVLTHHYSLTLAPQPFTCGSSAASPVTTIPATVPSSIVDLVQAYRITDQNSLGDALAAISYLANLAQSTYCFMPVGRGDL